MPDVELERRLGVELIKTGRWQASTGSWNPTPEDLAAAVEAQACPAVRKPVLKLGHSDPRFDGEPALGWFENLHLTDGGNTLAGDQVALPWLHSVQAAAYPSRSVEGNYNHTCSSGHKHRFVLTAVALLGVTPPAVKTIRNLNDLPAMLGVAASEPDVPEGAEHVQVTIMAADAVHTGAMIALIPTVEDAERLAVDGGEPADQLHLTLAFLGEAADLGARGKQDVIDHVSTVANGLPRIEAEVFSVNVFNPRGAEGRDTCLVWGVTGDIVDAVHGLVAETLHLIDAPVPSQHSPWAAHITAMYTDDLGRIADLTAKVGPISFDRLRLAFGGELIDIPLMEWPGEEPEPADEMAAVAAAAGNADGLHEYWTKGAGLAKWRGKPHPWTALFNQLKKHLSTDKAKRTASKWFLEVMGHTPNQKGVKAADVMAGRHSLPDFDEAKHERDGGGKFAPKWNAGALKQDERLGSRIKLGAGEALAGGAAIPSAGMAMAAIDSPDGRKLRLGLNILDEDINRWSGADKGHTAVLDQPGVEKLRAAIGRMQDAGKRGKDLLKVFEKRDTDLHKQEQRILNKQYPKLSVAEARELGTVDRDLARGTSDADVYAGRQDERLQAIGDPDAREQAFTIDREITAARAGGDRAAQVEAEKRMQALLDKHGEYRDVTAMMYARNGARLDSLHENNARLSARRAELTAEPVELSAEDRAELDQIHADLQRNDDMWGEFNDGSSLAGGTIPAQWGDIRWQVTMSSDVPEYRLEVAPPGAAAGYEGDGERSPVDPADLRKLAALLDKAGATSDVTASDADQPSELPAAEPEQPITTEEDPVSLSDDMRSRLGLADDADEVAALAAIDALKAAAEKTPEPDPALIQASEAAAEKATKAEQAQQVMREELTKVRDELNTIKASAAQTVKASAFDRWSGTGRLKPADRETWEKRYDRDPEMVTEILDGRGEGSEVPVMASGVTGPAEPEAGADPIDAEYERLFGEKAGA